MYWDEWIKAGAFVLLVAMGFGLHYLSTLDPAEPSGRATGVAVLASRDEAPAAPTAPQAAEPAPAPAQTTPQEPTAPAPPASSPEAAPAQPQTVEVSPPDSAPAATPSPRPMIAAAPADPAADRDALEAGPVPVEPPTETPAPPTAPPAAFPALQLPAAPTPVAAPAQKDVAASDAMLALRAAARTDDARAQYALALAYKMGRDVPADPAQSLLWLRRSAQNGLAVAARALGVAYEEGLGVEKDATEAAKWYTRGALSGDLQAMHNLAFFFTQGLGGMPVDGRQAAHWFRKAAERGLVASQVNLAILTSQGERWGIEKKLSDAYFWAALAAERGDRQAIRMRDVLAKLISATEKADLDKKIAAFRPLPIDIVANGGFEVAPEAFLQNSLRPPVSADELASVRQMLKSLGYTGNATRDPVGSATEGLAPTDAASSADIDAKTEAAIRAFQGDYGLPVTGLSDRGLMAALAAAPR